MMLPLLRDTIQSAASGPAILEVLSDRSACSHRRSASCALRAEVVVFQTSVPAKRSAPAPIASGPCMRGCP